MTKEINYVELSQELDTILAQLQADDFDVDEAIKLYERGIEISKQLETYLKTAQNKVTKLKASFDAK
jgi:exodeoxyribonuclease VII small subunit